MPKKDTIQNLKFDTKNFNKGSEFGNTLLEKSIKKFGFREAATLDKNGVLVGGNKRTAKAQALGMKDVEIIKADPSKVYALQYDDIDIETAHGRELALALNATAKANIVWDAEVLEATAEEIKLSDWGLSKNGNVLKNYDVKEISSDDEDEDEDEMDNTFGDDKDEEDPKINENVPIVLYITKAQNSILQKHKKGKNDIEFADFIIKKINND